MKTDNLMLSQSLKDQYNFANTATKMPVSAVFHLDRRSYLNEYTLFVLHYNSIPNFLNKVCIDCKKANIWFTQQYQSEIKDQYFSKRHFNDDEKAEHDDIFYFLYEDLLIYFDSFNSRVKFLYRKTEFAKVQELAKALHKFKMRKRRIPCISLIVSSAAGIDTKSLPITKPKLSIDDNYNEDFKEVHSIISKRLTRKNDKGLILLHGKPGTGKTSYIRYLIASIKKDVIFLPPNMAGAVTNPELISILIDNPNSIFVIEDAENIVVDRNKDGNSPVSALLNISDGLLADCLNVQIICSFNTDISKIDSALMRKGRLIAKYEFKELEIEKAQQLSNKLGFKTIVSNPMTLTAIYNQEEKDLKETRRINTIGFQTAKSVSLVEN